MEELTPSAFNETTTENVVDDEGYGGIPIWMEVLMYIMYTLIAVLAVGGNGIVGYLVFRYQKMRTVTNFFIVNLAIGDILMACLCIPFGFVSNLLLQYWPFGSVMCIVVSYSQAVSVFISAYTLIAISIDRYVAILNPLRPKMTKLQAKLIIAVVWLFALLTSLPIALLSRLIQPEGWLEIKMMEDKYICTEEWGDQVYRSYYSWLLMTLQYFVPLFVLIYTYARIGCVVWGKQIPGEAEDTRDRRMAASKKKMIKMMILCVVAFTACWLPFNRLMIVGNLHPAIYETKHINYIWFACHFLAMSHACYNPLIYVYMNARFRSGFAYVLRFLPCIPKSLHPPDFLPHVTVTVASNVHHNGHTNKGDIGITSQHKTKRTPSDFGTPHSLKVVIDADRCSTVSDETNTSPPTNNKHRITSDSIPLQHLSPLRKTTPPSFIDSQGFSDSSSVHITTNEHTKNGNR